MLYLALIFGLVVAFDWLGDSAEERHASELGAIIPQEVSDLAPLVILDCAGVGDVVGQPLNASDGSARRYPMLIDAPHALEVSDGAVSLASERALWS